jgi:HEAT repeat protein
MANGEWRMANATRRGPNRKSLRMRPDVAVRPQPSRDRKGAGLVSGKRPPRTWLAFCCVALLTLVGCASPQRRGFAPGVDADTVARHEATYGELIDSLTAGMAAETIPDREQPQQEFEQACTVAGRPGAEEERIGLCLAMCERLGPSTPLPARVWMIRQIERIGGQESVAALADQLANDPEPQVRETARRALQRNASPAAGDALRKALRRATDTDVEVALCNALGDRAEPESVEVIAPLTDRESPAVVAAAIAALADIGGADAVERLYVIGRDGRPERGDARNLACAVLVRCADRFRAQGETGRAARICLDVYLSGVANPIRRAALRGYSAAAGEEALPRLLAVVRGELDAPMLPMAVSFMAGIPGEAATRALVDALSGAPPDVQCRLIDALAARGDKDAFAALLPRMEGDDESVRIACARALQSLGNAAAIMPLAKAAARGEGEEREAARHSLARLSGEDIDAAMLSQARGGPATIRAELIRAIGRRHPNGNSDFFLEAATAPEEEVRIAALQVLAERGGPEELPILARLLTHQSGVEDQRAAEDAIVAVAGRIEEPTERAGPLIDLLGYTHARVEASLIRTLGRVGGGAALEAIRNALADPEPEVYDAAVRALAVWPEPTVLDDLDGLAGGAPDRTHRVLALRGYIRLTRLQARTDPLGTLERLRYAIERADDPAEKKLALAAAGDVPNVAAMDFARVHCADPALREEAAAALLAAARRVGPMQAERVLAAVDEVLGLEVREALWLQAEEVRNHVERYTGYITQWKISGPYGEGRKAEELLDAEFAPEMSAEANDGGSANAAADGADRASEVPWRELPITDADAPWMFDLAKAIGGDQRCAYARTYVWSGAKQPALLEIGSDDGVKVWLNGQVVHESNVFRGMAAAQDKATVTLRAGVNTLMLKISQAAGGWGFVCGVRAPDGTALAGLRFSADASEFSDAP